MPKMTQLFIALIVSLSGILSAAGATAQDVALNVKPPPENSDYIFNILSAQLLSGSKGCDGIKETTVSLSETQEIIIEFPPGTNDKTILTIGLLKKSGHPKPGDYKAKCHLKFRIGVKGGYAGEMSTFSVYGGGFLQQAHYIRIDSKVIYDRSAEAKYTKFFRDPGTVTMRPQALSLRTFQRDFKCGRAFDIEIVLDFSIKVAGGDSSPGNVASDLKVFAMEGKQQLNTLGFGFQPVDGACK